MMRPSKPETDTVAVNKLFAVHSIRHLVVTDLYLPPSDTITFG